MEFWKDTLQREQLKSRTEKLTRCMCDLYESPHFVNAHIGLGLQSMDSNDAGNYWTSHGARIQSIGK